MRYGKGGYCLPQLSRCYPLAHMRSVGLSKAKVKHRRGRRHLYKIVETSRTWPLRSSRASRCSSRRNRGAHRFAMVQESWQVNPTSCDELVLEKSRTCDSKIMCCTETVRISMADAMSGEGWVLFMWYVVSPLARSPTSPKSRSYLPPEPRKEILLFFAWFGIVDRSARPTVKGHA